MSALYFSFLMLAVVDCRIPWDAAAELARRGYTVLHMPPHPALPSPVASHPDMLLFFAPDAIYCTNSYQAIAQRELSVLSAHTQKPIRTVTGEVGERYPTDILLNAAPVGDRLFCLPAHTARELTAQAGYRVVPVRQGYAKCSAVPLTHNALITADPWLPSRCASRRLRGVCHPCRPEPRSQCSQRTCHLPAGGYWHS